MATLRELEQRADIADAVAIGVALIRIEDGRTVVAGIPHAVAVRISLIWIGLGAAAIAGVAYSIIIPVRLVRVSGALAVVTSIAEAVLIHVGLVGVCYVRAIVRIVRHAVVAAPALGDDAMEMRMMNNRVVDMSWQLDYGRLHEFACGDPATIGGANLWGSPPPGDSFWAMVQRFGFTVTKFGRNFAGKEKKVDVAIAHKMTKDAYSGVVKRGEDEMTLIAGDIDYVPVLQDLTKEDFVVHVVFWNHAAKELKEASSKFISLDSYFDLCPTRLSRFSEGFRPFIPPAGTDCRRRVPAPGLVETLLSASGKGSYPTIRGASHHLEV